MWKKGDKVQVRKDLSATEREMRPHFVPEMEYSLGQIGEVVESHDSDSDMREDIVRCKIPVPKGVEAPDVPPWAEPDTWLYHESWLQKPSTRKARKPARSRKARK